MYAFPSDKCKDDMFYSLCKDCKLKICVIKDEPREYLIPRGFIPRFTNWIMFGEFWESDTASTSKSILDLLHNIYGPFDNRSNLQVDDVEGLFHDAFAFPHMDVASNDVVEERNELPSIEVEKFYKLVDYSQQELYQGWKWFLELHS